MKYVSLSVRKLKGITVNIKLTTVAYLKVLYSYVETGKDGKSQYE
jgi:hypothetical protein